MPENQLNQIPHRRYNILTGEWVLVSPHRTKRPWQGKQEKLPETTKPSYDKDCYLCPGNTRASGHTNPEYDQVFSFVNDFSALMEDTPSVEYQEGLLLGKSEPGICKVVCFSPDHSLTLPLMEVPEIEKVVSLWQSEYQELGKDPGINHVQIFENKGSIMGCSNPHPHGQIWAQRSVPQEVEKKTAHQKDHWNTTGRSLLATYLEQELALGERIIAQNEFFVALVPYWTVWPYEAMIVPKEHLRDITQMNGSQKRDFADMIKIVTTKYDNLFETSFPYSSGIHQRPTDGAAYPEWHFHMSFYPPLLRSATVKKFMVGYEMFANPQRDITAESAADILRNLPAQHYEKV